MGEIEAWPEAAVQRLSDRTGCVVRLHVRVERQPVARERQTIGEVEGAKTGAGILRPVSFSGISRVGAEKASQESVKGDRRVTLTTPHHRTLEAELEIRAWA